MSGKGDRYGVGLDEGGIGFGVGGYEVGAWVMLRRGGLVYLLLWKVVR